jgi:transposase
VITIGIDPHKRSLTAAALDPHSRLLGQLRVPTTAQAAQQLLVWAEQWPQRRWAVEGATGLGRGIAQLLVAAGEQVLDVPAKLAAALGCSVPAAPARPTWPMPPWSRPPRSITAGCARSSWRTRP